MGSPSTIAIDGPAASGKSTIGARLAERLGYLYFDTGVMYRAVTWASLARGVEIDDEARVTALAQELEIDVIHATVDDGRQYTVLADGEDITWQIRCPEVDADVSQVSAYGGVRQALTRQQRRIGAKGQIVMVGRDIGTVVLPDADLKIYLDATAEERAWRRYREILDRDEPVEYEAVLAAVRRRDEYDSGRELAPLQAADDALIVDTTEMDISHVTGHLLALVAGWRPQD